MLQALPSLWIRIWSCRAERGSNEAYNQSGSEGEKDDDGDLGKEPWGDHFWNEDVGLDLWTKCSRDNSQRTWFYPLDLTIIINLRKNAFSETCGLSLGTFTSWSVATGSVCEIRQRKYDGYWGVILSPGEVMGNSCRGEGIHRLFKQASSLYVFFSGLIMPFLPVTPCNLRRYQALDFSELCCLLFH